MLNITTWQLIFLVTTLIFLGFAIYCKGYENGRGEKEYEKSRNLESSDEPKPNYDRPQD
jgi:hypothetical protein